MIRLPHSGTEGYHALDPFSMTKFSKPVLLCIVVAGAVLLGGCARGTETRPATPYIPDTLPEAPVQVLPETRQDLPARSKVSYPSENLLDWTPQDPISSLASDAWLDLTADATGIPRRALEAYAGASVEVAARYPDCRIGWNTVAGIGAVESLHGIYQQSHIEPNGQVNPHILGPALNGAQGVMAIKDTDGGALDSDTRWDRAVGPLQFIPSTWSYIGQDGNADGVKDPHNIDDAALTAAVYLCQNQRDMSTNAGWQQGVLSYNRSADYAHRVARYAEDYRAATLN